MTTVRQAPKPGPGRAHVPAAEKLVKAKTPPMKAAPMPARRAKPKKK